MKSKTSRPRKKKAASAGVRNTPKMDRISVLPNKIIDSILTRLPILEAVRTSILSRSWRYQWHSLSKIDLNQDELFQIPQPEFDNKIVKIIDYILLVHCGSVDEFALNIDLGTCNVIDRWILYVSRNGVKELTINKRVGERYDLPTCLFSCSDLTHLQLTKCIFMPPLATFKAFRNLTELFFDQVEITDEGLENLLNSSPLLSSLTLFSISPPPSIKINAPNLVALHILEFHSYSQFLYTPLLTTASFDLQIPVSPHNTDCKIIEFLASLPVLQSLDLYDYALQHLAVGYVPTHLPLVCPIKHLKVDISSEDLQELQAAFCILRSSSAFMRTLDLSFYSKEEARISADGFWKGGHDLCFRFDLLGEVWVTDFSGIESEIKFIEFLLANAPALKTMEIKFEAGKDVKDLFAVVSKLNRFPRVSPKAEVILPSYP